MGFVFIKGAIDGFIQRIESGLENTSDRDGDLMLALDRVALAHSYVQFEIDLDVYPDPPNPDRDRVRWMVSEMFPEYGVYHRPLELVGPEYRHEGLSNAVDDIVDLYVELKVLSWKWENTSTNDTLWHFDNGYRQRWGATLRNLQCYVFARQCGW